MTISDFRLEPPDPPKYPDCPICGTGMYDYLIEDKYGDIVGCNECTKVLTSEEYLEDLQTNAEE